MMKVRTYTNNTFRGGQHANRLSQFMFAVVSMFITSSALAADDVDSQIRSESQVPTIPSDRSAFTDTLESTGKETGVLTKSFVFPLQDFMPTPEPITLRRSNAQHALYFPVSNRLNVTSAELRLKFTNSISLLQDRSQIRVKLNDITISQLALRPDQSQVDVIIPLPAELLQPGFNNLTLWVAQHYTLECEDPGAPELWTEIDTYNSQLTLIGELQPIDAMLSELEYVMGPAVGNPQEYRVLLPEGLQEKHMGAGALVAEAVGLRHFYRSPLFNSGSIKRLRQPLYYSEDESNMFPGMDLSELSGADNILIGTRDELTPYLKESLANQITDAFLGIYPLAADPRYFVLLVSGTNEEELKRAAAALSFVDFPYTDATSTLIKQAEIPTRARFGRKNFINTDHTYTLKDLGMSTSTVQGSGYHQLDLTFDLPPDFYAAEDAVVELSLDFSYGAQLRSDSVLNVMLNETFERVISLSDPKGSVYKGYTLRLPLRSFKPGRNHLRFEPSLIPSVGGECIAVNSGNLMFTLYGSSTLKVPYATKYAALPDLKLFAESVFPYRRSGEPEPMAISLLSRDHETIASAWTLLAKMAQVADGPLMDVEIGFSIPQDDREQIVLATYDQLDEDFMQNATISLDGDKKYPYPVADDVSGNLNKKQLGKLSKMFGEKEQSAEPTADMMLARMTQNVVPQSHGLVTAFLSPYGEKRMLTVFAADDGQKLHNYMKALVQPSLWTKLSGDVALWSDEPRSIVTQTAGEKYFVGDASARDQMRYHVSKSPWWWILGVFVIIILLAWLTRILLRRRFTRRHRSDVRIED